MRVVTVIYLIKANNISLMLTYLYALESFFIYNPFQDLILIILFSNQYLLLEQNLHAHLDKLWRIIGSSISVLYN